MQGCAPCRASAHLDGSHPDVQAHQHPAVQQASHVGALHLEEVADQLGDVHLPVAAQHEAGGAPRVGPLRHKLGEHPHHGVLVLQRAASPSPVFIVLILAVPGRPAMKRKDKRG